VSVSWEVFLARNWFRYVRFDEENDGPAARLLRFELAGFGRLPNDASRDGRQGVVAAKPIVL
jgi:hypothetical protein